MSKDLRFYLSFVVVTGVVYGIHSIVLAALSIAIEEFKFPLSYLYIGFSGFSLLILLILKIISKRNIEIVGMTFMLLTTVKMMACYVLADFILFQSNGMSTEKWNFFILFFVFLFLETLFGIKILNPKTHK